MKNLSIRLKRAHTPPPSASTPPTTPPSNDDDETTSTIKLNPKFGRMRSDMSHTSHTTTSTRRSRRSILQIPLFFRPFHAKRRRRRKDQLHDDENDMPDNDDGSEPSIEVELCPDGCEIYNATTCNWDAILAKEFPNATAAERERFLRGRPYEKARQKMRNYMEWRCANKLDEKRDGLAVDASDLEYWKYATSLARDLCQDVKVNSTPIPRIVRFGESHGKGREELRGTNGKRIVQVIPALLDTKIAPQSFYAICVAIYLDLRLDRHSSEDIIVFIDVRSGQGMPNPPAPSLVPFVKEITKAFADAFPERLYACLVYPVPSPAKLLWALFKGFLHPKHLLKIRISWGMAFTHSPPPVDVMKEYCDEETIEQLETNRRLEFQ